MDEQTGVQLIGTARLCVQYFVATEVHVRYTEARLQGRRIEQTGLATKTPEENTDHHNGSDSLR